MRLKLPTFLLLLALLCGRLHAQPSASNQPAQELQPGQMPYFDAVPDPIEGFNRCSWGVRSLGLIFGAPAARALVVGQDGVMVAINPPRVDYVPLNVATAKLKLVTADDYGMMTTPTLDVSFGN